MSALVKPFAALWRARGYVIAGVVIYLLSFVPLPYKDADPKTLEWWQVIIGKAFGSLDKVAYALLFAGLIYALLSDLFDLIWSNKLGEEFNRAVDKTSGVLQAGLDRFVIGLGAMSFEAIKVWIDNGQAQSPQLRVVGASSLRAYFGKHLSTSDNVLDFVLDSIVDESARADTQTWDRFSTTITIRKSAIPGHLQWEETKAYSVVCHAEGCSIPIQIENSWQVGPEHILSALSEMEFSVDLEGQQLVNLRQWRSVHNDKLKDNQFTVSEDGITLSYDGVWLRLGIKKDFSVRAKSSRVSVYERSLISDQDRCYALAFRHPTKGLRMTITLEGLANWVVKQPIASALAYKRGANVVDIKQPHQGTASVDMVGWTLPGLALVTEWTPR
jgi:hypothetical protein